MSNIQLITSTPDPDSVVVTAARLCYSNSTINTLCDSVNNKVSENKKNEFINKLLESGHMSPFEHVSFTFGIEGISRVCTHQLVRHRHASISQQSQRYCAMDIDKESVVLPPTVKDSKYIAVCEKSVQDLYSLYTQMVEDGIPKQDARFILPHGWETRLILTMNARELHHFFKLRICKRAQWEIRELAIHMLSLVQDKAPLLFKKAGPSCSTNGVCEEAHPCGEPYAKGTFDIPE